MPLSQSYKRRCAACRLSPDDQTRKSELEKTTSFICRATLVVQPANAKKKKKMEPPGSSSSSSSSRNTRSTSITGPVADGEWRGGGWGGGVIVCLLVGCLTSQQQASVSQGRICSDNLTCCHTEIKVADPTFYLTQSQYTDTGPTSPSTDPITPGAWQGSHWSANFEVTSMTRPRKNPGASGIRTRDLPLSRGTP